MALVTLMLSCYIAFSAFSSSSKQTPQRQISSQYSSTELHQISYKGGRENGDMINGTTYAIPQFKGM